MEYLVTYEWAILIISVVPPALFQLGVFGGITSSRARPGRCQVVRPYGPGSTAYINLAGMCSGQLPQYVAQFNLTGSSGNSYIGLGTSTYALGITRFATFAGWINRARFALGCAVTSDYN